jgi:hypothetical protein
MIGLALALVVGASPLETALALRLSCDTPLTFGYHDGRPHCTTLYCWDADGRPALREHQVYDTPGGWPHSRPGVSDRGGFFRLHYTLVGPNAVPGTDGDANGIPDYIEHFGVAFEDALAAYRALGFRDPEPDVAGGDARYDVYFSWAGGFGGATYWDGHAPNTRPEYPGAMPTFIAINPVQHAFADEVFPAWMGDLLVRQVAAHELHHAVQMGYGYGGASWVLEGMSVMMEQVVLDLPHKFPFVTDFRYVFRYEHPELTLLQERVTRIGYANGLFYTALLQDMGGSPAGYAKYWDSIGRHGVLDGWWAPGAPGAQELVDQGLRDAGLGTLREAFRRASLRSLFLGDYDDGRNIKDAYRYHGLDGGLHTTELAASGTFETPALEPFGYAAFRLEAPAQGPVVITKPAAALSEWDWVRQFPDCTTSVTALDPAATVVTVPEDGRALRSWLVVRHVDATAPRTYAFAATFAKRPPAPVSATLAILDAPARAGVGDERPVIARLTRSDCRLLDVTDRAAWAVTPAGAVRRKAGGAVESLLSGPVSLAASYAGAVSTVAWPVTGPAHRAIGYATGGGCRTGGGAGWGAGAAALGLLFLAVRRRANT